MPQPGCDEKHDYDACRKHGTRWRESGSKVGDARRARIKPDESNVTLYHTRYVVIRYAINTKGKRELTGDGVETGKLALTHWKGLPHFGQDWQLWQGENGQGAGFGPVPGLAFHRSGQDAGFAPAPEGAKFDELTEAPKISEAGYKCEGREATAGLILFCRIEGNKGNLGFGKIEVLDVTLTRPKDVEVLED